MKEKVSVIMACYNCEDTLQRAIDSILNQSYKDWVLVCCDDGSTDNTWNILNENKAKYPDKFILIQNEENRKLPYSLNRCLEQVQTEYVARMDADDISQPERLETQVKYLESHPEYAVCGTDMVRFDESGDYGYYRSVDNPDRFTLMKEVPFCHATIMMCTSAYNQLGGYTVSKRTIRGQDVDLWFRFFAAGFQGNNIHLPLYKVCEDKNFVKRGGIKSAWYVTQTRAMGFKLLNYPITKYYLIPRPLVSRLIPRKLKLLIRDNKEKKDN